MLQQLALLAAFALISGLLDLPFTLWQTFRLEERFGFNKMTWRLWLVDALKSLLLGALIGLPIAALILWLMGAAGTLWWLWAWGAWIGVQPAADAGLPDLHRARCSTSSSRWTTPRSRRASTR